MKLRLRPPVFCRIRIKRTAIAKCYLFFHYCCQRNLILLFLRYKTSCKTRKNTWIPFILLESCLYGKWMVFSCLHCKFRVSTQIIRQDYCITKSKKFSTCGGLLMTFRTIFLFCFLRAIQNIYVNSNPFLMISGE